MKRLLTCLPALLLLLATWPAQAQEAAQMAPADAAVFIEVDNLAQLRQDWENDPLGKALRNKLMHQSAATWAGLQAALGMPGPKLIDTYFGQSIALIVKEPGDNKPAVVLTKVAPADSDAARIRLNLVETGKLGAFTLYKSQDEKGRFAISPTWVAFADARFADYLQHVLQDVKPGSSLADDATFKSWVAKLPAQRHTLAYVNKAAEKSVHAASITRTAAGGASIRYTGSDPKFAQIYQKLGTAGVSFGPLPEQTIAAISLNFTPSQVTDTQMLDRLLAPKTYTKDIQPKLDSPVLVFAGQGEGALPVAGLAIKMKDPAVAADLQRMVDGVLLLANIATARWQTAPIAFTTKTVQDVSYQVADVGSPLAQKTQQAELASIRVSYGPVGPWYLVCTSDSFFERMVQQAKAPGHQLTDTAFYKGLSLQDAATPVATALVQAPLLQQQLTALLAAAQKSHPALFAAAATQPATREGKLVKTLLLLQEASGFYQGVSAQFYREKDDSLVGQVELQRRGQ